MRIWIVVLLWMACLSGCSNKQATAEESNEMTKEQSIPQGLQLIESNDCLTCHHTQNTLVGPSYKAIANKYKANEESIKLLSGKILEGGSGVWGDIPMNAHPSLSQEEARTIVEYILSAETIKK